MGENQTRPTGSSVVEFIDGISDRSRQADAKALVRLMRTATGEKPKMWGPSIIGFGSHHYTYDSGREGDMPLAGFSPRKAAMVLYIGSSFNGAEECFAQLGRRTKGKGCLYIKKLADVNLKVLEALVAQSVAARRSRKESPAS